MCSLEPLHPEPPGTLPALFKIAEVYLAVQPTVLPDCVILEPIQPKNVKTHCLVNQVYTSYWWNILELFILNTSWFNTYTELLTCKG